MANATGMSRIEIPTNIGKLIVPIIMIDAPMEVGVSLDIPEGSFNYYSSGCSITRSNTTTDPADIVVTEFESISGTLKQVLDGGVTKLYVNNEVISSMAGGGYRFAINTIALIRGTNGVYAYTSSMPQFYWYGNPPSYLELNTSTAFGYVQSATIPNTYPRFTFTAAAGSISVGQAIFAAHDAIPDPYRDGGDSDENTGGDGTFDDSSDTIVDSTLPTISAANTGFTRIYNPTLAQVQALANYLWTDPSLPQTLWNHIKQFLENPMDAFIAFNLVPCAVPNGGTVEFKVMYIGTGVNITAAASQFVDVDCGSIAIDKYYDSALDYSPYTKISIFLPFIGSVQLDTDDVMGKTVSVKYRIDIVSGGCVAKIFVDNSIHYQYSGHCAITIPFTSADFTGYISAMIQTAKAVTSIAAGAAGNTALAASMAGMPEQRTGKSTTTTTISSRNPSTNRMRAVASTTVEKESTTGTEASFGSLLANNFNNTVGTVMGSKAIVDRSGSFSGNTGYLGVRRPFVIIERPRMCNPADYGRYNGRPSMLTLTLGECEGFTQVQQVQLTGFSATNPELDEIGALLKSGVIL